MIHGLRAGPHAENSVVGCAMTGHNSMYFKPATAAQVLQRLQGKAFYLGPKNMQNFFLGTNVSSPSVL